MAKLRFEVVKFDIRTGHQVEVVFSTSSKLEAERVAAKYNDDRTPQQRREIEFRWRSGDPSYPITMGK
jgi:hypothetical protein